MRRDWEEKERKIQARSIAQQLENRHGDAVTKKVPSIVSTSLLWVASSGESRRLLLYITWGGTTAYEWLGDTLETITPPSLEEISRSPDALLSIYPASSTNQSPKLLSFSPCVASCHSSYLIRFSSSCSACIEIFGEPPETNRDTELSKQRPLTCSFFKFTKFFNDGMMEKYDYIKNRIPNENSRCRCSFLFENILNYKRQILCSVYCILFVRFIHCPTVWIWIRLNRVLFGRLSQWKMERFERKIIAGVEALYKSTQWREYTKDHCCLFDSSPACYRSGSIRSCDRREATGTILLTFTRFVSKFVETVQGKNRWRLLTSEIYFSRFYVRTGIPLTNISLHWYDSFLHDLLFETFSWKEIVFTNIFNR